MATTPQRVVSTVLQETTATMKAGDFDVNFTYKNPEGEQVSAVQVMARNGNAYLNCQVSNGRISLNYDVNQDRAVINAILDEVADIIKPVTTV